MGTSLEQINAALSGAPLNPALLLRRAECLLGLGRIAEAREAALRAAEHVRTPALLDALGSLYSAAGDQTRALDAYSQAVALAPGEPRHRFNRATVRRFLGDGAGAEADYDAVIAAAPTDYEAYLNRAELRRQTATDHHITAIESLLSAGIPDWRGEVSLRYAAAKELEDIGEFARSFAHLNRGANLRRSHLEYDVERDVATVEWIRRAYPAPTAPAGNDRGAARPIFIVGLPRSGTTLVERILGSHSQVAAGGELPHFSLALVAAVRKYARGGRLPREEFVARTAQLDFAALGQDYLGRVRRAGIDSAVFTDKLPLNYLYCGLIRRALPAARIIHIERSPMASCYAMYKTLFRDGYPFTYDLRELARYYAAYRRLMGHWHQSATLAAAFRYESLVTDFSIESRRLLHSCGLEWEPACESFHLNPDATTTASAAQVRRPLYQTSVAAWRNYERELAPLQQALLEQGVAD